VLGAHSAHHTWCAAERDPRDRACRGRVGHRTAPRTVHARWEVFLLGLGASSRCVRISSAVSTDGLGPRGGRFAGGAYYRVSGRIVGHGGIAAREVECAAGKATATCSSGDGSLAREGVESVVLLEPSESARREYASLAVTILKRRADHFARTFTARARAARRFLRRCYVVSRAPSRGKVLL